MNPQEWNARAGPNYSDTRCVETEMKRETTFGPNFIFRCLVLSRPYRLN